MPVYRLSGRVGVKLQSGRIAFSTDDMQTGLDSAKTAVLSNLTLQASQHALSADPLRTQCNSQVTLLSKSQPQARPGVLTGLSGSASISASSPSDRGSVYASAPEASPAHLYNESQTLPVFQADCFPPTSEPCVPDVPYDDQSEDDALQALQELDALLTPASIHRRVAPTPPTPSSAYADTMKYQPSPTRSAACAHTSTADRYRYSNGSTTQLHSPESVVTNGKTLHHGAVRRLWTAGRDEQQWPAASSPATQPMRILKRPSIATNSASPDAVSPPLANRASQCLQASTNSDGQPAFVENSRLPPGLFAKSHLAGNTAAQCEPVSTTPQAAYTSSTSGLSNERLKSQSVLRYLQQQGQSRALPVSTESCHGSKSEAPGLVLSAHRHITAAVPASKASPSAAGQSFPNSTGSDELAVSGQAGATVKNQPQRSDSPVDELVLELQLQHLMEKVPGLIPAMAVFAIKVCMYCIQHCAEFDPV